MNSEFVKLKEELIEQLSLIPVKANPLERLSASNEIISKVTEKIKEILKNHLFKSEEEEIHFFKSINPEIISHFIEEGLKYNIMINQPINTSERLVNYYEEELRALQSFFRLNNFHYQYFKNEFKELDKMYFLRNSGPMSIPIPEISNGVAYYCTPMSYLFAKFIAHERVQYFILEKIAITKNWAPVEGFNNGADDNLDLKWTGDIINLVEIAYGIWLTGQLNNGNASLNQIVRWLEKNLGITIGIVQKRFTEIERRKRLSITKFIDQMKQAILRKIDSGNS